jgi:hypothetical protein
MQVPKGYNPKGLALSIIAYCNLHKSDPDFDYLDHINFLAGKLICLDNNGYSGSCWGYNFDWQARGGLFFPRGTPNVVVTSFCATALVKAFEITKNDNYLNIALSSANFIINDLKRSPKENGFLFSYSPLKGNDRVYNASLMASKLLSYCYRYTGIKQYADLAGESVLACLNAQNEDGSWIYGELPIQNWIDSFHTGYNLECLQVYHNFCGIHRVKEALFKGLNYYLNNFFLEDGTPKYYNDKIYPIDIHSPGQLFVVLSELDCFQENRRLADKVLSWTIENMQNEKGYFYYQKYKGYTIKIPYMRWSQAFFFYGMSYYDFEIKKIQSDHK